MDSGFIFSLSRVLEQIAGILLHDFCTGPNRAPTVRPERLLKQQLYLVPNTQAQI